MFPIQQTEKLPSKSDNSSIGSTFNQDTDPQLTAHRKISNQTIDITLCLCPSSIAQATHQPRPPRILLAAYILICFHYSIDYWVNFQDITKAYRPKKADK